MLLASTTITGSLQVMINVCTDYVEAHGLNFNASKTNCIIKGKPPFASEATLLLNGTTLTKENTIKYLGAILGNYGSATHVAQRIKAANGSYLKLQAAGMHGGGLTTDEIRHIYALAIQPTLTYGAHAIHLKKTDLQLLGKAHEFPRTMPIQRPRPMTGFVHKSHHITSHHINMLKTGFTLTI